MLSSQFQFMQARALIGSLDGKPDTGTAVTAVRDGILIVALALPFVGQAFPYGFPLFFPVAFMAMAASLACASWKSGWTGLKVPANGFTLLFLLVVAFYLYGLLLTERLHRSLLGDFVDSLALVMVYTAAANTFSDVAHRERTIDRFLAVLLAAATAVAIVGAFKFMLLLRGQRIGFVDAASGGKYPFGTSLIQDYNMFALTLLCAALIALARLIEARSALRRVIFLACFIILCGVGFFAGSRRFWIVAPLGIVAVFARASLTSGFKRSATGFVWFLAPVVLGVALAVTYLGSDLWSALGDSTHRVQSRLLTLLDADRAGGFESRLQRWELAYDLANGAAIWAGQGFDYIYMFSCKFGSCAAVDYPHNPVLSALLYSGVLGALSVLAWLGYLLYLAFELFWRRSSAAMCGLILIVHFPFILISSNTVLSVKSFLICAGLCSLLSRRSNGSSLRVASSGTNDAERVTASVVDAAPSSDARLS